MVDHCEFCVPTTFTYLEVLGRGAYGTVAACARALAQQRTARHLAKAPLSLK